VPQDEINALLVRHARAGKRVVRLKGGDPFVFGRGGEELEALAEAGLKFQVVPGVSAAEGCAAYAGIPLTLRGVAQAVVLTTGHTRDDGTPAIGDFQPGQTLALYMGVAQYAEIAEALLAKGYATETPVAVVESGTTDRQRVVRTVLGSLAAAQTALDIRPPALLIVGETTRYADRFSWFAPSKVEHYGGEPAADGARVSYRQNVNKVAP
jgi:uroporphyrin-III C-methyltransferase